MLHRLRAVVIVILLAAAGIPVERTRALPSAAAVVCGGEVEAAADATLRDAAPGTPQGGAAALQLTNGARGEDRILLHFDVADAVPAGATIYTATLVLPVSSAGSTDEYTAEVRGVGAAWTEGTVTWANAPSATAVIAASVVSPGESLAEVDVTALVNLWTTGALSETGVLLSTPTDAVEQTFYSRDAVGGVAALPKPKLLVQCAAPVERVPVDRAAGDAAQASGLAALRATGSISGELRVVNGALRTAALNVTPPASAGADNLARARWLFGTHAAAFRLANPSAALQLRRRSRSDDFLAFRQMHEGVPVFASHVGVLFRGTAIVGVLGRYAPLIDAPPTPRLSALQAERIARVTSADRSVRGTNALALQGKTALTYFAPQLLGIDDANTYLTWQVFLSDGRSVLIDADSGAVRYQRAARHEEYDLQLDTMALEAPHGNFLCGGGVDSWFTEDGMVPGATPDTDGLVAFTAINKVDAFWRSGPLWRDSYDDDGTQYELFVNTGDEDGNPIWRNAHYNPNCELFEFGDGVVSDDVVGHEVAHAVTSESADMEYFAESGALNESFSDIFGWFVDQSDWLLGEGTSITDAPEDFPECGTTPAIRDMFAPRCFGQPQTYAGRMFANPGDWCNDKPGDWCGVHTNSGIHNKAANLIIAGGSYNGYSVTGIGANKAKLLFYRMLTQCLGSSSDFGDARYCAVTLASTIGLPAAHTVCQVRNAYAAVGIGSGDADCDGVFDSSETDNDNDGIADAADNCPSVANPSQSDMDGNGDSDVAACDADIDDDGEVNVVDNCVTVSNFLQSDDDGDGIGDACDDSDLDGVMDRFDNCDAAYNPDQKNMDGDGFGDVCDANIDGDTVLNESDNCPYVANSNQANADGDARGDKCDNCPNAANDDQKNSDGDFSGDVCDADDDNDGHSDRMDNCPFDPNPEQYDPDGDGKGWVCDELVQLEDVLERYNGSIIATPAVDLPIWGCPQCAAELPANFRTVVHVTTPAGYRARVVNASGRQVAKSPIAGGAQTLTFAPQSYEFGGPAARGVAVDMSDAPYSLVIDAPAGADPTAVISLTVEFSATIKPYVASQVLVPIVIR